MSLRIALIIGIIGAAVSLIIDAFHILDVGEILRFLYRTKPGNAIRSIPSITLLAFFVILLIKQK
jgi:hypothetical protein